MRYILVFANTYNALSCERILMEIKCDITILPTPSYVTNSCGISIGVKNENLNIVKSLIKDEKIMVKFIYDLDEKSIIK